MGNSFWCQRCDIEKFQLSQTCATQFLKEHDEDPDSDSVWIKKLRCIDDMHSKRQGLTEAAFYELVDKFNADLKRSPQNVVYCRNRDLVLACLHRNPNCMLNCKREMDEFIDCVDAVRVRKVKLEIEAAKKRKRSGPPLVL